MTKTIASEITTGQTINLSGYGEPTSLLVESIERQAKTIKFSGHLVETGQAFAQSSRPTTKLSVK